VSKVLAKLMVGFRSDTSAGKSFSATNPRIEERRPPDFFASGPDEISTTVGLAHDAFVTYSLSSGCEKGKLLRTVAAPGLNPQQMHTMPDEHSWIWRPACRKATTPKLSSADAADFETYVQSFLENPELAAEVFGPTTLVVRHSSRAEMLEVARNLEGQDGDNSWDRRRPPRVRRFACDF